MSLGRCVDPNQQSVEYKPIVHTMDHTHQPPKRRHRTAAPTPPNKDVQQDAMARIERGLSQQMKQTNVGNNQNDLEVALFMSLSDGSAVADSLLCPLCDETFSRWAGYNIHVTMHHKTSVQNNCAPCKVRFYSRKLYKQHIKRHKKRAIKAMRVDPKRQSTEYKPILRNMDHTHQPPKRRHTVPTPAPSNKDVQEAMDRIESGLSQPMMQIYVDDNQSDLELALYISLSHRSAVSDSLVLACPLCDMPYDRNTGYNNHVNNHHKTSVQKNCTQCKVRFYSCKLYKQHMKIHKKRAIKGVRVDPKPQPVECKPILRNMDHTHQPLKRPHTAATPAPPNKNVQQVAIDRIDNNQNDLEGALYISLSDGSAVPDSLLLVCPLCDMPYDRYARYNKHVKMIHESNVQRNCTQCKVRFYSRKLYKQHMKIHKRKTIKGKRVDPKAQSAEYKPLVHNMDHTHQPPKRPHTVPTPAPSNKDVQEAMDRIERGLSQQVMQPNVDDNKTDLEVALAISLSDGTAMSDFPVCPLCDEPYSRETGYNNHVTTLHNPSAQKNCYNCTQCKVRFYSRKLYKQHKKGHERRQSWGQTNH